MRYNVDFDRVCTMDVLDIVVYEIVYSEINLDQYVGRIKYFRRLQ